MNDFFDQNVGNDDYDEDLPVTDAPVGPTVLVNGSYQSIEVGAPLLPTLKAVALQAGFGKFKVFLNGAEIRKSSVTHGAVPSEISTDMKFEIRPFDEAGWYHST